MDEIKNEVVTEQPVEEVKPEEVKSEEVVVPTEESKVESPTEAQ